jgi:hypothetical protein
LRPSRSAPECGRPARPGTRSDQFPLGLIVTGSRVNLGLLGAVNETLGGVSSWEHHP